MPPPHPDQEQTGNLKSNEVNFRCFACTVLTFIACWLILLFLAVGKAKTRALLDYTRTPAGVRDFFYPSWLLETSRHRNPRSTKLLFLGDSTVYGISSTESQFTICGAFAHKIHPFHIQTFAFALNGLGARDFAALARGNARPDDFVIIEVLLTPRSEADSKDPLILDTLCQTRVSRWKAPFLILRSEPAMMYGKTPALIPLDSVEYAKKALKQRTIKPDLIGTDKLFASFDKIDNGKLLHDTAFKEMFEKGLNTQIQPSVLKAFNDLFIQRNGGAAKTLVYFTPINPHFARNKELGEGSIFRKNIQTVAALAGQNGIPCLDYTRLEDFWKVSDFHDGSHLTDQGSVKLGRRLAEDFQRLFLK